MDIPRFNKTTCFLKVSFEYANDASNGLPRITDTMAVASTYQQGLTCLKIRYNHDTTPPPPPPPPAKK